MQKYYYVLTMEEAQEVNFDYVQEEALELAKKSLDETLVILETFDNHLLDIGLKLNHAEAYELMITPAWQIEVDALTSMV